ncbi:MAG: class I SAM-dependent methyltransferase [Bdellovibrionales bacterium]|nr:class I SAM-dependent methyltransferase [Bdellovibrionales bacterium]
MDSKYWSEIYGKKTETQLSWFQTVPQISLDLIQEMGISVDSEVIDIGGGDSRFVDHLLKLGFKNISVLDVAEESLVKAQARLGKAGEHVQWVVSDVTKFNPAIKYDLWHDRATFHFLTDDKSVENYLEVAYRALKEGGSLIVSTFSQTGPKECSGLPTQNYSQQELKATFHNYFSNFKCLESSHQTPWGTSQDFVYCGFKKI